jgi:hypothetical protein
MRNFRFSATLLVRREGEGAARPVVELGEGRGSLECGLGRRTPARAPRLASLSRRVPRESEAEGGRVDRQPAAICRPETSGLTVQCLPSRSPAHRGKPRCGQPRGRGCLETSMYPGLARVASSGSGRETRRDRCAARASARRRRSRPRLARGCAGMARARRSRAIAARSHRAIVCAPGDESRSCVPIRKL